MPPIVIPVVLDSSPSTWALILQTLLVAGSVATAIAAFMAIRSADKRSISEQKKRDEERDEDRLEREAERKGELDQREKERKDENARWNRERYEREAAQARLIALEWLPGTFTVIVHNFSEKPIFYVEVVEFSWSLLPEDIEWRQNDPTAVRVALTIPAGGKMGWPGKVYFADGSENLIVPTLPSADALPEMKVRFIDANGFRWFRENHKEPRQIFPNGDETPSSQTARISNMLDGRF